MAAESLEIYFAEDLFLAVPMSSLIHRKASISDLFIRLPSNRMIKIAHKGGPIDHDRLSRLSDKKNVTHFYVQKQDFGLVVGELVRGAVTLNDMSKIPADIRIAKFFDVAETVYSELLRLPVTDESLGRAVRLSQEISDGMRERPDFVKLIKSVVGMGDHFSRHSLGTVVMSNLVAVQLEWKSQKLLSPITNGAFFHDLGLKEIPEELRFKTRIEMNKDEALIWEEHPAIGASLLSTQNFITPDVLRIVQEHHEIPNGTGFPGKLRLDRIFPMAKVVSLGNMLAHDIFDPLEQGKPFVLDQILQKIDHVYGVMYGADLARAARKIFKADKD